MEAKWSNSSVCSWANHRSNILERKPTERPVVLHTHFFPELSIRDQAASSMIKKQLTAGITKHHLSGELLTGVYCISPWSTLKRAVCQIKLCPFSWEKACPVRLITLRQEINLDCYCGWDTDWEPQTSYWSMNEKKHTQILFQKHLTSNAYYGFPSLCHTSIA